MAVVTGFYRTCVIDGVLMHSPAEYVRRPNVPAQSPTLGLNHLQFVAMLAAARASNNQFDFALVCLLGLLGLRIFEATGLDVTDLDRHPSDIFAAYMDSGTGAGRREREPPHGRMCWGATV